MSLNSRSAAPGGNKNARRVSVLQRCVTEMCYGSVLRECVTGGWIDTGAIVDMIRR